MKILVLNCGSSSIKADVLQFSKKNTPPTRPLTLLLESLNTATPQLWIGEKKQTLPKLPDYHAALDVVLDAVMKRSKTQDLIAIGHRVAHGDDHKQPTLIDNAVERDIEQISYLAPQHNPIQLVGIRKAKKAFPKLPHIAVFDTAFHHTLPRRAYSYPLPQHLVEKYHIRRYGFHGTSHQYVARKAADYLKTDLQRLRLISCHLGSGCSLTAIEWGRSVETSMGMSPLEGVPMMSRSGDIDAGILLDLMENEELSAAQMRHLLHKESGLKGMTGKDDLREIEALAAQGDDAAQQALKVFAHRILKYIGAYAVVMGGVDAIIFTGGIGENSRLVRQHIGSHLAFLGMHLDDFANQQAAVSLQNPVVDICESRSPNKLLVIKTDEQLEIARQCLPIALEKHKVNQDLKIPIAVSARHVHLSQKSIDKLFGKNYQLRPFKELSQKGNFAAQETLTLIGTKGKIENVRILMPPRNEDQVEISRTDEFILGVDAPVRASGDLANTPSLILFAPQTGRRLKLKQGVICAWRHIHISPEEAARFGVEDKDIVEVQVKNKERSLTFGNVLIRVSQGAKLEMHIDTDEANAAEINTGEVGELVGARPTQAQASLKSKHIK
ncbi:acetate/propionate family kinase [Hugenholtzia roseola]|uniref:acetate/propionate family kinase n=1 Tax=Hugenholtzia roseola TaxID=1002 RepID=UPI000424FBCB|nr:acetate/propionate family kinase [Hugenholtzia roseola]